MEKKLLSLLVGLALMIVPSMAATGHINGCTNTGEWNNCCTKTFNITAKPGYKVVDVIVNGVSKGAITSYTFGNLTSAQVLKVITEAIQQYTITYNLDGGTATGNPTSYTVESEAITLVNPTKDGYTFTGWTGTGLTEATTTVTIAKGSIGDRTYTANWEKDWLGWNEPTLAEGLTPVNWNGSSWVETTEANWDYNYNSVATATHNSVAGNGDGKWANAQTADGSLYVWIPRYSYKITSGEHSSGNSWNSLDNPGSNKIEVKFSNGTVDDTTDSYIAHPAFTFGTDELEGIWVAKYEASQGSVTTETSVPTSSTSVAKSIPGVTSWRDIVIRRMFDYAYNTYRNADSHLMKNVEWGAVAYLTNAIGRIPYVNNSSDFITGNAGGSQDAEKSSDTIPTYTWDTANGVKASTTHNVYGIYDMSGGTIEYVSAYLNNEHSNLSYYGSSLINSYTSNRNKYVDVYPVGTSDSKANNYAAWSDIKGDAVYETSSSSSSTTAWDGDYSFAPTSNGTFFQRGGGSSFDTASSAGIFYFYMSSGVSAPSYGFRVVLGIK